jgi:hydrogenase nickel incorporation protein HypA/HybF
MHELAIARSLFNDALVMAFKQGMDRINCLKIKLGVASGIDKDMLRHSFIEHIFPETIAEDAEVEITLEPLVAKCVKCQGEITQTTAAGGCLSCGSKDLDIIGGTKASVEGIE